jgi:hypothetical protein
MHSKSPNSNIERLKTGVWAEISSGIGPCFPLAGGLCNRKRPIQRHPLFVQYNQQTNPLLPILDLLSAGMTKISS